MASDRTVPRGGAGGENRPGQRHPTRHGAESSSSTSPTCSCSDCYRATGRTLSPGTSSPNGGWLADSPGAVLQASARRASPVQGAPRHGQLLSLPGPQPSWDVPRAGAEQRGAQLPGIVGRLRGAYTDVWPQHERRVADEAASPEGHPAHVYVDDHLDERFSGSLDNLGERRRQVSVRRRMQLLNVAGLDRSGCHGQFCRGNRCGR